MTGVTGRLDGLDVSAPLASCLLPGTSLPGGVVLRCPGLSGALLGVGAHELDVTVALSDGTSATGSVAWQVRGNTEP